MCYTTSAGGINPKKEISNKQLKYYKHLPIIYANRSPIIYYMDG